MASRCVSATRRRPGELRGHALLRVRTTRDDADGARLRAGAAWRGREPRDGDHARPKARGAVAFLHANVLEVGQARAHLLRPAPHAVLLAHARVLAACFGRRQCFCRPCHCGRRLASSSSLHNNARMLSQSWSHALVHMNAYLANGSTYEQRLAAAVIVRGRGRSRLRLAVRLGSARVSLLARVHGGDVVVVVVVESNQREGSSCASSPRRRTAWGTRSRPTTQTARRRPWPPS